MCVLEMTKLTKQAAHRKMESLIKEFRLERYERILATVFREENDADAKLHVA